MRRKQPKLADVLSDVDPRDAARYLGLVRVGLGVGAMLFPRRVERILLGRGSSPSSTPVLRGLAGRDIALGVGLLTALEKDTQVRGWLEAGAMADGADAVAALGSFGDLPSLSRWLYLAGAAGAAALGVYLAGELD